MSHENKPNRGSKKDLAHLLSSNKEEEKELRKLIEDGSLQQLMWKQQRLDHLLRERARQLGRRKHNSISNVIGQFLKNTISGNMVTSSSGSVIATNTEVRSSDGSLLIKRYDLENHNFVYLITQWSNKIHIRKQINQAAKCAEHIDKKNYVLAQYPDSPKASIAWTAENWVKAQESLRKKRAAKHIQNCLTLLNDQRRYAQYLSKWFSLPFPNLNYNGKTINFLSGARLSGKLEGTWRDHLGANLD